MTNNSSAIALEAKAVSHCFGSQAVLDSINLSLRQGELTASSGPMELGNPLFCTFCKDCSNQAKAMLLLEVHPLRRAGIALH